MSDKVDVVLAHPLDGKEVGDRVSLEPAHAKAAVHSGHARYANKTEEKKAASAPTQNEA